MSEQETPGQMLHRLLLAKGVLRSRGRWLGRYPSTRAKYEEVAAAMQAAARSSDASSADPSLLGARERIARLETELAELKARLDKVPPGK